MSRVRSLVVSHATKMAGTGLVFSLLSDAASAGRPGLRASRKDSVTSMEAY
jgi:hypothetical protein